MDLLKEYLPNSLLDKAEKLTCLKMTWEQRKHFEELALVAYEKKAECKKLLQKYPGNKTLVHNDYFFTMLAFVFMFGSMGKPKKKDEIKLEDVKIKDVNRLEKIMGVELDIKKVA